MEVEKTANITFAQYVHLHETRTEDGTEIKGECTNGSYDYRYNFRLCQSKQLKPFSYLCGIETGLNVLYEDTSEDKQAFAIVQTAERLEDSKEDKKQIEDFLTNNFDITTNQFINATVVML